MVRALYVAYAGPLYSVVRSSDSTSRSIPLLTTGGYANAKAQDDFCAGTDCHISAIFDQSPNGNDLRVFGSVGNYTRHDKVIGLQGNNVIRLYTVSNLCTLPLSTLTTWILSTLTTWILSTLYT
jgi:hypothetical protein